MTPRRKLTPLRATPHHPARARKLQAIERTRKLAALRARVATLEAAKNEAVAQVIDVEAALSIALGDRDEALAEARAQEREAMVASAAKRGWAMKDESPFEDAVRRIADLREQGPER